VLAPETRPDQGAVNDPCGRKILREGSVLRMFAFPHGLRAIVPCPTRVWRRHAYVQGGVPVHPASAERSSATWPRTERSSEVENEVRLLGWGAVFDVARGSNLKFLHGAGGMRNHLNKHSLRPGITIRGSRPTCSAARDHMASASRKSDPVGAMPRSASKHLPSVVVREKNVTVGLGLGRRGL